jgi:hypothetical protein
MENEVPGREGAEVEGEEVNGGEGWMKRCGKGGGEEREEEWEGEKDVEGLGWMGCVWLAFVGQSGSIVKHCTFDTL